MQDKKKSIDFFYAQNDESFGKKTIMATRFRSVIDEINLSLGDSLAESGFDADRYFIRFSQSFITSNMDWRVRGLRSAGVPFLRKLSRARNLQMR